MTNKLKFVKNAAGRMVPSVINGKKAVPFKGVGKHFPTGRRAALLIPTSNNYPSDGDKRVPDLETALKKAGLKDGMTISTHHHFRNGDTLPMELFDIAASMGKKDLMWFPSAAFPCHEPLIKHLDNGVIHHIEGSLNGPLGDYVSQGKMRGLGALRSHGGRARAIQDGDVHIDIAVIAAPTADKFGNCNGLFGPSACGPLSYAYADAMYADKVILVTDNLVPFPCYPWQIQGIYVDHVVEMDSIGDPSKIVSGTTQLTRSPDRLLIAEMTAEFVRDAGLLHENFNFQAGAGGTSLAFLIYMAEIIRKEGVKVRTMVGGTTKYLVDLLEEGIADYIFDGQAFDLDAIKSLARNPNHIDVTPFFFYNYHSKGFTSQLIDAIVVGATEVDLDFNANVVTHSDGRMLHGIGGWQNCLYAKCTIMPIPSFRNRIPVIVDDVTTLVGPGELVDVIVTERGIAINPKRKDLIKATRRSKLPIRPLAEIKDEVEDMMGGAPDKPVLTDEPISVVEWVDGTVLDTIWQVEK